MGVRVACVVQGDAQQAERYCARHGLAGHCVGDPEKKSYQAMGFPRARLWNMIFASPELKARRKEALAAGCSNNHAGTREPHSDVLQLPGAVLVVPSGKILWIHHGKHTGDLPLAKELLGVVRRELGQ